MLCHSALIYKIRQALDLCLCHWKIQVRKGSKREKYKFCREEKSQKSRKEKPQKFREGKSPKSRKEKSQKSKKMNCATKIGAAEHQQKWFNSHQNRNCSMQLAWVSLRLSAKTKKQRQGVKLLWWRPTRESKPLQQGRQGVKSLLHQKLRRMSYRHSCCVELVIWWRHCGHWPIYSVNKLWIYGE